MKKALVSFVAAVMLLSVIPASAFAESIHADDSEIHNYTGDFEHVHVQNEGTSVTVTGNVSHDRILDFLAAVDAENGGSVTIEGDVSFNNVAVRAQSNSTVTVDGNVVSMAGMGVIVSESTVTVRDDVVSGEHAVYAQDNSTVTVGGNVSGKTLAVEAQNNSTVTVGGNVSSSEATAVFASDNSSITVYGDIYAEIVGACAAINSTVIVEGNIFSEQSGIYGGGNSTIIVNGNVFGKNRGVRSLGGDNVIVSGDVSSEGIGVSAFAHTVVVEGSIKGDSADVSFVTLFPEMAGEIIVGKLESTDGIMIMVNGSDDVPQEVLDKVFYIINSENVTVDGSNEKNGYEVANEGTVLTVKSTIGDADMSFGDYATWEKKEDGSYLVTVQRGGDLVFKAVARTLPCGEVIFEEYYEGPAPETAKNEDGFYLVGYRFTHFQKVVVDGKEINLNTDCIVRQESHGLTTVKLTDSFLSTLEAGKHTITVHFTDGTFDINFEV